MSPDHPYAKMLSRYYGAMGAAMHDPTLDAAGRQAAFAQVADQVRTLLTADFVIHTGGIRLAATGGRDFTMAMGARRNRISGNTFRPSGELSIIADDTYAVVRGRFRAEHNGLVYDAEGAGAWRFNSDGQATEHWELGDGHLWDAFFIGCDPDTEFTSGEEFWLRDVAGT